MPVRNALRDVNPLAITLCKQGANRQRIFLRKSTDADELLELPGGMSPILKSGDDWTAFYCVVAQPGAEEDPGMTGDRDSVDVWESPDEIRKAAHRLLKNGAYVNTRHDDPADPDCAIVESAVALTDLTVGGSTIPEGSWYVAIEPSAELRKAIDAGDVTGVSLEGTGVRVKIEKADPGSGRGGSVENLIRHYMKKPHPFTACVRDNTDRFGRERAERICAKLKDMGTGTTKWREGGGKVAKSAASDEFVTRWAGELRDAGVTDDDVPLLKAYFDEQAELADEYEALAKRVGTLEGDDSQEDDEMGLADDFAALKKSHDELTTKIEKSDELTGQLVGLVGKLTERVESLAGEAGARKREQENDAENVTDVKKAVETLGSLADKLDSLDSEMTSLAKSVQALGEGGTSQRDEDDDTIRKAREKDPLAGLLA